jgi:hypothetical protein
VAVGSSFSNARSITFDGSTKYLQRSTGSPSTFTSNKIGTWSFWVKPASGSAYMFSWGGNGDATSGTYRCRFHTNLTFVNETNTGTTWSVQFNNTLSTSAWTHVVLAVDTTQVTNTNRIKCWLNGTQQSTSGTPTWPVQNAQFTFADGVENTLYIGRLTSGSLLPYNGMMDEFAYIDGHSLTPSSFATANKPIDLGSLTFGTQGTWVRFENNSSTSTLGTDDSPNPNNWLLIDFTTSDATTTVP